MKDEHDIRVERRQETFCNEHSGVCVKIQHVEATVEKVCKKLNQLMFLIIVALLAILGDVVISHLG